MSKLLEINHCRKQFDGTEVLTDLSLAVEEGQVLSIIGPSGSGKSTLLRCATLLEISSISGITLPGTKMGQLSTPPRRSCGGSAVCSVSSFRTSIFFRITQC